VFVDADATPETLRRRHARALEASPHVYHPTTVIAVRAQLVLDG